VLKNTKYGELNPYPPSGTHVTQPLNPHKVATINNNKKVDQLVVQMWGKQYLPLQIIYQSRKKPKRFV